MTSENSHSLYLRSKHRNSFFEKNYIRYRHRVRRSEQFDPLIQKNLKLIFKKNIVISKACIIINEDYKFKEKT